MSNRRSAEGGWGFLGTRGRTYGQSRSPVFGRSLLAIAIVLSSSAAYADPVRIVTSGHADTHEGDSTFALVGNGLFLSGEAPGSLDAPRGDCVIFLCRPGDVVDLSTRATPNLSIFDATTARFDGTTYDDVFLTGELFFSSTSVITPNVPLGGRIELFAPFSMTGHMSAFDNVALGGTALFSTDLRGAGTVRIAFTNDGQVGLQASRVTYEFQESAPVPEPASMTLLGIGLAGLIGSRKQRSGRRML